LSARRAALAAAASAFSRDRRSVRGLATVRRQLLRHEHRLRQVPKYSRYFSDLVDLRFDGLRIAFHQLDVLEVGRPAVPDRRVAERSAPTVDD